MFQTNLKLWLAFVAAILFVAEKSFAEQSSQSLNYNEETCYVSGLRSKLRCYSLERPLYEGSTESVTLKGVIVPADAVTPKADPLVVLAGGPGEAASNMVARLTKAFRLINNDRDIIFFDIRGSGMSDAVGCEGPEGVLPLTSVALETIIEDIKACRDGIEEKVKAYSTKTSVEDLEALRVALAAPQFNLWGGSYGTRFAFHYIHDYQANVRRAVLDGVAPFTPSYVERHAENAMNAQNKLIEDCAADKSCAESYPNLDIIAMLDKIGEARVITFNHPVTGQQVTTTTSRNVISPIIFSALYSPDSRVLIPFVLSEAVEHDNWGPMSVLGIDVAHYMGLQAIYTGPLLGINCAEEGHNFSKNANVVDPFFHGAPMIFMNAFCNAWPTDTRSLPTIMPNSISVPTLLISGSHDPVTPPELAAHAVSLFEKVQHLVVENGGHINSTSQCMRDIVTEFITQPDDKPLDTGCMTEAFVPKFIISPSQSITVGEGS